MPRVLSSEHGSQVPEADQEGDAGKRVCGKEDFVCVCVWAGGG